MSPSICTMLGIYLGYRFLHCFKYQATDRANDKFLLHIKKNCSMPYLDRNVYLCVKKYDINTGAIQPVQKRSNGKLPSGSDMVYTLV